MKNLIRVHLVSFLVLTGFAFSVLVFSTLLLSAESLASESYLSNAEGYSGVTAFSTSADDNADEFSDNFVQINLDKAVGGLYATVPRPLWDLIIPVGGMISSHFGPRGDGQHYGTDFASARGTLVKTVQDGVVIRAAEVGGYGLLVDIDHGDNVVTRYAHLSSYPVSAGDVVSQGDIIGAVGSTGNSGGFHLHFEIRINGTPVNPLMYLPSS